MESDRKAASLPSSPDPFKTPSRTSPLLPLPPYPPPEHTSRDGSGKSSSFVYMCVSPLGVKDRDNSVRFVGRGIRLVAGC